LSIFHKFGLETREMNWKLLIDKLYHENYRYQLISHFISWNKLHKIYTTY